MLLTGAKTYRRTAVLRIKMDELNQSRVQKEKMSTNFPTTSFYSKNKSKRVLELETKLENGVSELKKKPLPPPFHSTLQGHPTDWKIFHKQDEALVYAKQRGLGLMTFAFEEQVSGSEGRRKYLVTHPTRMWLNHISRPPDQRCSYEVIPHGSQCKLYFDLEFNKLSNPECDGEKMVETLLTATFWAFQEIYKLNVVKSDVLVLDACTPTKFSQHLIFHSSEFAFQDNIHVGNFVKHLVMQVKEGRVPEFGEEEQKSLFVKNDKNELVSFCDLAVYTKNRNFRLFLASKFEKKIPLVIAKNNKHFPMTYDTVDWPSADAAVFSSSLITYFNPRDSERKILTFCNKEENTPNASNKGTSFTDPSLNGYTASPWSEIDSFIGGLVAPSGFVRQWVYYEKTETIVYHIQGTRYCNSIGREHKRNHIKYVVNLPNGTYYQSCFDSDCQSHQPPQPIPPEHLPWFNLLTDSW